MLGCQRLMIIAFSKITKIKTIVISFLVSLSTYGIEASATEAQKAYDICQAEVQSGNYVSALNVCLLQKPIITEAKDEDITLSYYLLLIDVNHFLENSAEEEAYFDQLMNHPHYQDNSHFHYQIHRRLGRKDMRMAQYNESLSHFHRGLEVALDQKNLTWVGISNNDIGAIHRQLNNYQESIHYYKNSLEAKKRIGNDYLIGNTQRNIGVVHTHLEEYDQALYFYLEALNSFKNYTQTSDYDQRVLIDIVHIYQDIALTHQTLGNKNTAQAFKKLIIDNFHSIHSIRDKSMALMNIAQLDIEEKDYKTAEVRLIQALELSKEKIYEHTPEMHYYLSLVYQQSDRIDLAIQQAEQGLVKTQEVYDSNILMNLHKRLSEMYDNRDKQKTIHHLQAYIVERDKFLQNKYNKSVKAKQFAIELMSKEQNLAQEKYTNLVKSSEIITLQKNILAITFLLSASVVGFLFVLYKRSKEKQLFMNDIKYHKQQLLLFTKKLKPDQSSVDQSFKLLLVETMNIILETWEKHTNLSRIDLAQQSNAWTVSIDNGTLRTRSFDKYLNITTLPKFPRWKNIVKTCHFILADESLPTDQRSLISGKLDQIMLHIKEKSMQR